MTDKQTIQSFYEAEADQYYSSRYEGHTADNEVWRARAEIVVGLVGQVQGLVVDLGCGPGVLAARLSEQADRVVCSDLALNMLKAGRNSLRARRGNVDWVNADLTHLPFKDNKVAVLSVIGVFGLIEDPAAALREFARVVEPGGRLVLQVPNSRCPRRAVEKAIAGLRIDRRSGYEARLSQVRIDPIPYGPSELNDLLRSAGFAVTRRRFYDFRLPLVDRISGRADAGWTVWLQKRLADRGFGGQIAEGVVLETVRLRNAAPVQAGEK